MDTEDPLQCLQKPATWPYPESDESSQHRHILIPLTFILIVSSHLRFGFPSGLFPSDFPTIIVYVFLISPVPATVPTHLILLDMIILVSGKAPHYPGFSSRLLLNFS